MVAFPEIGCLFVGSRLCVAGILWVEKTPVGNHYGRHGNPNDIRE